MSAWVSIAAMKVAVVSAGLLLATVAPAAGDDAATARLESGGACDLTGVAERANDLLGRAAIDPDAPTRLHVDTTQDGARLVASLELVDETGAAQPTRTIEASSCDELAESLAIVISIVLRRDASARPIAAPAAVAPPLQPPPAVPAPPPAPEFGGAAPPLRDESGYSPVPGAERAKSIEVGVAMATNSTSVLLVGGRLERERTAFGLAFAVATPRSTEVGNGSVHVRAAALEAAACARHGRMSACGVMTAGAVRGNGEDLIEARSAIRPLAGLGVRVDWRQPVSRHLGLVVFADVEQRVLTTRFLVDEMPVWTSPARQASLGAGVFLRVP